MTYSNKELLKAAHMTITELELEIADLKSQLKEREEKNNKLYKRSFLAWVTGLTEKDISRKYKEWLNTPRNLTSNPK